MRVSKLFLSKIIKEEIKRILYEEAEEADELNATKRLAQIKSYNSTDSDSGIERRLINLFVKYRNIISKNPTHNKLNLSHFENQIKDTAPDMSPEDIVDLLQGKVDRQMFSFIKNILLRDRNMKTQSDKLDNYEMSITPDEQSVYQVYNKQDPDSGFMRVPKDDEAYDQEDVRKDRKTLTQT
jgi:hypothetical protein